MARTRSRGGRRPDYQWVGLTVFTKITMSSAAAFFAGSSNLGGAITGTIARVRGDCLAVLDVGAADDSAVAAVGLIVGTDAAVSVGSNAFPSPVSDLDAEWLWHSFFALRTVTATQTSDLGGQARVKEIDSKAMRKFKPNENLVAVAATTIQSGTPTVDIIGAFRVLIQS